MRNCFCSLLPDFSRQNQKATISLAEAERAYAVVCEEFSVSPNSHTQLWKYLKDFSKLGITETEGFRHWVTRKIDRHLFASNPCR